MIRRHPKKSAAIGAALIATAAAYIAPSVERFEGVRTKAYRDIVGVWTICAGETRGVRPGQVATREECRAMLIPRIIEHIEEFAPCVERPMNRARLGAFGSLAYNIGSGGVCRSTALRLHNQGAPKEAVCAAFLYFNKAGGRLIRGLEIRREAEQEICLRED